MLCFFMSIIKALPCLCLGRDDPCCMPSLQRSTQEMLKHKLQISWSCTAGVWLKANDLFTNVGCAEGHHKILWYLPGEPRTCRHLNVDLRNRLTEFPVYVPRSGTSALQTRNGGHQPRLASDSPCFPHTFLCADTCGEVSVFMFRAAFLQYHADLHQKH